MHDESSVLPSSDPSEVDYTDAASSETAVDLEASQQILLDTPAEVVVANHVIGLYELARIHLLATPPNLRDAALAIDAVGCLVEGLGERLGPDASMFIDALATVRMFFVQIKDTMLADEPAGEPTI